MTLKSKIKIINLSFLVRFLKEIPVIKANKIIISEIIAKKIKLLINNVRIVSKIRNINLEIGFNLCQNEFPGK